MIVLVACEESQRVCSAFRELGINAFSCDLVPCSGGHPEWHFKEDVLKVIENKGGQLENGNWIIFDTIDLMIAHPPCTFLATSGNRWMTDSRFPNRAQDREEAIEFFMKLWNAPIKHIAIENPIGIMSTRFRKPNQIIQPYMFGDSAKKTTCLWLKNLPNLEATNIVSPGEFIITKSGKKMSKWYAEALYTAKTPEERRTIRSKTFPGIAKAMAEQWSKYLKEIYNERK